MEKAYTFFDKAYACERARNMHAYPYPYAACACKLCMWRGEEDGKGGMIKCIIKENVSLAVFSPFLKGEFLFELKVYYYYYKHIPT